MRKIEKIVIHCSDSDIKHHDNIDIIRQWHIGERGFADIGYHYVITKTSGIQIGRPISRVGAHVKGQNNDSIGICLTGKSFFSSNQLNNLYSLCRNLIDIFNLDIKDVLGHYELDKNKTCPNLNMTDIRSKIQFEIFKKV